MRSVAARTWAALIGAALVLGSLTGQAQSGPATVAVVPRIERGRSLASAGNCRTCHTRAGGPAFAGGVAFETPFGPIYSSNITPDLESGIGRWTEADLRRAMHEGIGRGGRPLYPAFPYPSFTKVGDADVSDIYAYLRTLAAVRYSPPAGGSLFSMRWTLSAWNLLFFRPGRFTPDPSNPADWNRGAYLVEGLGHCGACHTPRNWLLAERTDRAYAGAVVEGELASRRRGHWFAVNLTGAKDGLTAWSVAELAKYLQTGISPRAGAFGPMYSVTVNGLGSLETADLQAMAVYLKSLRGLPYQGEAVSPERAAAGAALYKDRCEKCHGASGRGGFFGGPPLAANAVVQGDDPASLINILLDGPATPGELSFGAWETMKPYRDVLDDAEIAAICNFIRGSWGNRARLVSPASVRRQR